MKTRPDWPFQGKPLQSKVVASSNSVQKLPTAYMGTAATAITGAPTATTKTQTAKACLIAVRANPIRIAFDADPGQAAGAVGIDLAVGETYWMGSAEMVNGCRFISAGAGAHAYVTIAPEV